MLPPMTKPMVLAALILALAACDKKPPPSPETTTATADTPPPSASAPPSASLADDAAPADSASTAASASAAPSASAATGGATALANPSGAGVCGKKPLPYCPLQGWMKKNTGPDMNAKDFAAVAKDLDTIATFAPKGPGYPHWVSISKDGANAAKAADLKAVKAACRGCHDQYKKTYRAELRTRPIPP